MDNTAVELMRYHFWKSLSSRKFLEEIPYWEKSGLMLSYLMILDLQV